MVMRYYGRASAEELDASELRRPCSKAVSPNPDTGRWTHSYSGTHPTQPTNESNVHQNPNLISNHPAPPAPTGRTLNGVKYIYRSCTL